MFSKNLKGTSLGVSISLLAFMVFFATTMIDFALLFSVANDMQRFAKGAALYAVSLGRNFKRYEETNGQFLMDIDDTPVHVEEFISKIGPKTCNNGRCTIYVNETQVYINDGYTCKTENISISQEMNRPYQVTNGIYAWHTCVPSVGVKIKADINIPSFFINTRQLYFWGEASVYQLNDSPQNGFLPWE